MIIIKQKHVSLPPPLNLNYKEKVWETFFSSSEKKFYLAVGEREHKPFYSAVDKFKSAISKLFVID